ncbi:hypothetical protein LF1_58800 [Rubripirellula obstinata]|uniref:Uncharacterized protein n=1 Tax=Rubripirellula obstinata TaxID=406547 RepID=A0A5B1CB91_9BACT|nr:hypothetical protein LF1_58800 [Rubripirellula obstinata]
MNQMLLLSASLAALIPLCGQVSHQNLSQTNKSGLR